jgi:hypothetical protein
VGAVSGGFLVKAVGMTFYDGYPESFLELRDYPYPLEASLIRQPDNAYDPNAVAVLLSGRIVGHLPRYLAARVGPRIDAGARYVVTASILVEPGHEDLPGLLIDAEEA